MEYIKPCSQSYMFLKTFSGLILQRSLLLIYLLNPECLRLYIWQIYFWDFEFSGSSALRMAYTEFFLTHNQCHCNFSSLTSVSCILYLAVDHLHELKHKISNAPCKAQYMQRGKKIMNKIRQKGFSNVAPRQKQSTLRTCIKSWLISIFIYRHNHRG